MERIFDIKPASFDVNQGATPAHLYCAVKGAKGAVVFTVRTGWYLPGTSFGAKDTGSRGFSLLACWRERPGDDMRRFSLDPDPAEEREDCYWLGGGPGFVDYAMGIVPEAMFRGLVSMGLDWLFNQLEASFVEMIGE